MERRFYNTEYNTYLVTMQILIVEKNSNYIGGEKNEGQKQKQNYYGSFSYFCISVHVHCVLL
ncbi:protein of unknown function [Ruminococcaceae bacterium BL-4]|nr:protein of unknown function [Ruminococcaceae bacterium BL-4]